MNLSKDNRELLVKYKDLISKHNYIKLFQIFQKLIEDNQNNHTEFNLDDIGDICNFLYTDCNIDYLKYMGNYVDEFLISCLQVNDLNIPSNIHLNPITIDSEVEILRLHIDPKINNTVSIASNDAGSRLRDVYIEADQECSIKFYAYGDINIENLYIGSNIESIMGLNEIKSIKSIKNIHVSQLNRKTMFKIPRYLNNTNLKIDFINDINESLNESFDKNIPNGLREYLKANAEQLHKCGVDLAAPIVWVDEKAIDAEMSKQGLTEQEAIEHLLFSFEEDDLCPFFTVTGHVSSKDDYYCPLIDAAKKPPHYILNELRDFLDDDQLEAMGILKMFKNKEAFRECPKDFFFNITISALGKVPCLPINSSEFNKKLDTRQSYHMAEMNSLLAGRDNVYKSFLYNDDFEEDVEDLIQSCNLYLDKFGYYAKSATNKLIEKFEYTIRHMQEDNKDKTVQTIVDNLYKKLNLYYKDVQSITNTQINLKSSSTLEYNIQIIVVVCTQYDDVLRLYNNFIKDFQIYTFSSSESISTYQVVQAYKDILEKIANNRNYIKFNFID